MADTAVQRRKGTTAQHAAFTGLLAETTFDTDLNRPVVHDGVLPGGFPTAMLHLAQTFPLSQTLAAEENFFGNTADPDNAIVFFNPPGVGTNTLDFRTNGTLEANFLRKYNTTPFNVELAASGGLDLVTDSRNVSTGTTIRFLTNGIRDSGTQMLLATFFDNGRVDLTGQLQLPNTTSALGSGGGIYFGGNRAIHNFGATNFFAGVNAGNLTLTGSNNTAVGVNSLDALTSGINNSALGVDALTTNTTGFNNSAFGVETLALNLSGNTNSAFGMQAMDSNSSGNRNSAFGANALSALLSGNNNLSLGHLTGDNLTTGSNNIIIGYDIDSPTATNSNTLTIGNLIFGTGVDGVGTGLSTGNIGIGIITPGVKFDVAGGGRFTSTVVWGASQGVLGADGGASFSNGLVTITGAGVATFATGGAPLVISATGELTWGNGSLFSSLAPDGSLVVDVVNDLFNIQTTASTVDVNGLFTVTGVFQASFASAQIGFFGVAPVGQQSIVDLTNGVTPGGTPDNLDDFAGLIYIDDAAIIRDNIYQLGLKVDQILDALFNLGLRIT